MEQMQIAQALNSVQVRPELQNFKNGEESLAVALADKRVFHASVEEVKQVLRYCMMLVGLREANIPDDLEKAVLIQHICKSYQRHTLAEIKLAFEMAISGKLEVDPNCYENFSCLYFSNIMNAFRSWSKVTYMYLQKKEVKLLEQKKEITDDEMEEWVEEWKEGIKKIENPALVPTMFYDYLIKTNKLLLTREQKINYATVEAVALRNYNLAQSVKADGEKGQVATEYENFKRQRANGCFKGVEYDRIIELAKKIAVFDYFKSFTHVES